MSTGIWLRRFGAVTAPRQRLVCFPPAGGSASAFRGWRPQLPADVDLLAVRYPGREDRIAEPFVEDMDAAADRIAAELAPLSGDGLALFGHSMGAALAFEVTLRLERPPVLLALSGRAAPGAEGRELPADDDESAVAFAKSLGSANASAYDDEDLRPLLLPALRADLRMIRNHAPAPGRTVNAPLAIYVGEDDPDVTVRQAQAWSDVTSAESSLTVFPGGHFYLTESQGELLDDLSVRLGKAR